MMHNMYCVMCALVFDQTNPFNFNGTVRHDREMKFPGEIAARLLLRITFFYPYFHEANDDHIMENPVTKKLLF